MTKQEHQAGKSVPNPDPAMRGRLTVWQASLSGVGVLLISAAVGVIALYYLGDIFDVTKELCLRIRGADKSNSTGVLLVFVTLVLLGMLLLRQQLQGGRTLWGLVLVGMVFSALASNLLPQYAFWGWTLAALPALLVIHHGLYLGLIKPRVISQRVLDGTGFSPRDTANLKDMVEANDRYFNTSNIALRYGLPALAIIAVGAVTVHVLNPVSKGALNAVLVHSGTSTSAIANTTLEAARLGALGAYVYVLLYLGQRGFRHDITSGAALWCAVTLALGPLMAAALSKIWFSGLGSNSGSAGWSMHALYVAVGMSPRYVAQTIARHAHRLGADTTKYVPPERSLPLAMIRGITPQIEERLHEEGIHDVVGMAMADPLRLQRNTNFDKHQILGWIDSALLAHALPEAWEYLEKKGLRGARDLSWYVTGASKEKSEGLEELAADGLTQPVLRNVALRLSQDAQAQRIQLLYQLVDEGADTGAPGAPLAPPRPATEQLTSGLLGLSGAAPELPAPPDGGVEPATNPAAPVVGAPPAAPRQ